MQKQPPQKISPAFNSAAALPEDDMIRSKIAALGSPLAERAFKRLERKEVEQSKAIEKRFAENRDASVQAMTRDIMDKKMKEMHPELKPKHLPTISREELEKDARKNAQAAYAAAEKAELERAKEAALSEKRAFLKEVSERQPLKGKFNEASNSKGR